MNINIVELLHHLANRLWGLSLIFLILGVGVYYSVLMKFPQIRLIKEMFRLLKEHGASERGLSPLQSFVFTAARTIGVGNIAGMATGIYFGGPGSIFWLWVLTIMGSSIAILEGTLGQLYKRVINNKYTSSPAHYMAGGFRCRKVGRVFAIVYSLVMTLSLTFLMPGVQSYYIVQGLHQATHIPAVLLAMGLTLVLGLVIFGGLKRMGKTSQQLSPIAGLLYVGVSFVVIIVNIDKLPGVIALIFRSALGKDALFGAMLGSALQWGIRRGVHANEIGTGTSAVTSATSQVKHPAQQGLLGGLSVYIGTLFVCTTTTLMILVTDSYNVVGQTGEILFQGAPGVAYGNAFVANAIQSVIPIPNFGHLFVAIAILIFSFVALTAFYLYAESSLSYLVGNRQSLFLILRALFLATVFGGTFVVSDTIWTLADIGNGLMAWTNMIALIFIGRQGVIIVNDYVAQRRQGIQAPVFDPTNLGLNIDDNVWHE